jgi:hypothetical protein
LLRFHLSNGLVSLLGNLALMRLLVEEVRLPVLASNCIAILCCSVVNFCLGDSWTFAADRQAGQPEIDPAGPATMHRAPSLRLFSVARVGNRRPPPAPFRESEAWRWAGVLGNEALLWRRGRRPYSRPGGRRYRLSIRP